MQRILAGFLIFLSQNIMLAREIDLYGNTADIMARALVDFKSAVFDSVSSFLIQEHFLTYILGLTLCFFIYSKIGKDWNREDFYKMGIYLITYCVIYAIFYSEKNYNGFIDFIQIPAKWFNEHLEDISKADFQSTNFSQHMVNIWDTMVKIVKGDTTGDIRENVINAILGFVQRLPLALIYALVMFCFIVYALLFTLLTQFASQILLILCPFVLPCIVIQPLRQYFYSWLKLYLSTNIQLGLGIMIVGIALNGINNIQVKITKIDSNQSVAERLEQAGTDMWFNTLEIVAPIVIALACIALLSKVPAWAQGIIGSGDGEHKTGLAGLAAVAGKQAGKGFQAYSEARNGINYKTGGKNSWGRSAMAGLASMAGMGGLSQRIRGQTSGDKEAYRAKMQNGSFTAEATPFTDKSGNKGK
ncbi:hypothetical protein DCO58_12035 [Helicobacter saguini]|uniref:Conjugal transfer protein TrbL n=1 Tax=Helicobacter saguini TaxID=1548018 RepID=A0A347VQE0_9HELI|nr:type IV secretion system protein [Helicobacter saguini]MWV60981.1 hypothetical protein [Helicobacter saguini]MWV68350.1 hypothetical protein [Helicobacter saguini]MWV70185.1 hypothetical protein [Helicobacter saguini]MWV72088.1 hypothetical protein [Helicobacter saguini]TLD93693.1 hypothetical protein LS64_007815 [Helicobacter saguini]